MIHVSILAALVLLAAAPQQALVMTTVPNARLRTGPSEASDVVREEELGSVHTVTGRTPDGWLKLSHGYMRADLTTPYTDATRAEVVERIIRARLENGESGFEAWNQLLGLTGQNVAADRETQARFALYQLKALRGAADTAGGLFRSRFAFALAEDSTVFANHEPAGQWILRNEYILATRERFKDTPAADDIAWFAAENGFGGECEGQVPCYVTMLDGLQGEYLRLHPDGRHRDAALARIVEVFTFFGDPPDLEVHGATKAESCADLKAPLSALQRAVAPVRAAKQGDAAATIARLVSVCR